MILVPKFWPDLADNLRTMEKRNSHMPKLELDEASILTIIADQRGKHSDLVRKAMVPKLRTKAARQVAEMLLDPDRKPAGSVSADVESLHSALTKWVVRNTE